MSSCSSVDWGNDDAIPLRYYFQYTDGLYGPFTQLQFRLDGSVNAGFEINNINVIYRTYKVGASEAASDE